MHINLYQIPIRKYVYKEKDESTRMSAFPHQFQCLFQLYVQCWLIYASIIVRCLFRLYAQYVVWYMQASFFGVCFNYMLNMLIDICKHHFSVFVSIICSKLIDIYKHHFSVFVSIICSICWLIYANIIFSVFLSDYMVNMLIDICKHHFSVFVLIIWSICWLIYASIIFPCLFRLYAQYVDWYMQASFFGVCFDYMLNMLIDICKHHFQCLFRLYAQYVDWYMQASFFRVCFDYMLNILICNYFINLEIRIDELRT